MIKLSKAELKAKLQEDKVVLTMSDSEKINILMQEVARLNKSNIKLQEKMIEVVSEVKKSLLLLNKELTRTAKQ